MISLLRCSPWAIPTRLAFCLLLCAPLAGAGPAEGSPKTKFVAPRSTAKKSATTWTSLIEYTLMNGSDRPIKGHLSRNLGFDSDLVPTKALRVKAKLSHDKFDHSIYVAFNVDSEGKTVPTSVMLAKTKTARSEAGLHVQSFAIRVDLTGKVLNAVRSTGLRGNVEQTIIDPSEESVKSDSEYEMSYFLKGISLEQLGSN